MLGETGLHKVEIKCCKVINSNLLDNKQAVDDFLKIRLYQTQKHFIIEEKSIFT